MWYRIAAIGALVFTVFTAQTAHADGCEDGQVNVGFLDGHVGTEVCMPAGEAMQDVTPEVSVGEEATGNSDE